MITVHVCAHTHLHRHRHIHTPDSTDKLGQRRKPAWSRHRSECHVRPGHNMAEPTSMIDVWVGSAEFWKLSGGIAKGQGAAPLARALEEGSLSSCWTGVGNNF